MKITGYFAGRLFVILLFVSIGAIAFSFGCSSGANYDQFLGQSGEAGVPTDNPGTTPGGGGAIPTDKILTITTTLSETNVNLMNREDALQFLFSNDMDKDSVDSYLSVTDANGRPVGHRLVLSDDKRTLLVRLPLSFARTFTVEFLGGLSSMDDYVLPASKSYQASRAGFNPFDIDGLDNTFDLVLGNADALEVGIGAVFFKDDLIQENTPILYDLNEDMMPLPDALWKYYGDKELGGTSIGMSFANIGRISGGHNNAAFMIGQIDPAFGEPVLLLWYDASSGPAAMFMPPLQRVFESKLLVPVALGDINGDGIRDFMIVDYGLTIRGDAARMYIFFGRPAGQDFSGTIGLFDSADVQLETPTEFFAISFASLGDFNGDGIADFAVGGEDATYGSAAYVFYGSASIDALKAPDVVITSADPNEIMGYSVAGGDVNWDDAADLLVGAPYNGDGNDKAYLFYGKPDAGFTHLWPADASVTFVGKKTELGDNEGMGMAVAMGDFDGDGHADPLLGAPFAIDPAPDGGGPKVFAQLPGIGGSSGRVYMYLGRDNFPAQVNIADGVDVEFRSGMRIGLGPILLGGNMFGAFILAPEYFDVNNDGYDDMFLGTEIGGGADFGCLFPGGEYLRDIAMQSSKIPLNCQNADDMVYGYTSPLMWFMDGGGAPK